VAVLLESRLGCRPDGEDTIDKVHQVSLDLASRAGKRAAVERDGVPSGTVIDA
jgi:hypothetical protein